MYKLAILFVVLVCALKITDCAKILCVFLYPSGSQQAVYRVLTDELSQQGHDLIIVSADPGCADENQHNVKEIDLHDITYSMWNAEMRDFYKNAAENPHSVQISEFYETLHKLFVRQFRTAAIQKIIKEDHKEFDLVLLDANVPSSIIFTHFIKAPVILLSSGFGKAMAQNQEFLPTQYRLINNNASVLEEMFEIFKVKHFERQIESIRGVQDQWFKNVTGIEVTHKDLQRSIDLFFLNVFPIWEGIRPIPTSVVNLGGLHIKPGNELPQDLQNFFNSSEKGVIYVNFGTEISSSYLPPEKVKIFVNVLSELPYGVLWKWDKGELPGKGRNIVTAKEFPQADLLRHPKMKLFITQGSIQATDEAIAAGVPLIGIPFLMDQFLNCENYVYHNIGLRLDITNLTEEILMAAITKAIADKEYKENIFQLRTLMRDKPKNSLNSAISWIEYVLKHKSTKHLQSPVSNIHWAQYIQLELLIIALVMVFVFFLLLVTICYYVFKGLFLYYQHIQSRRLTKIMYFPR